MTAFFSLQYSARLQASTSLSTRSFGESILFLHLNALRGSELRLVRTVGMVGLTIDETFFKTFSKNVTSTETTIPSFLQFFVYTNEYDNQNSGI